MLQVDALLPEFDHEISTTRKLLERVPDDKLSWTPHPKSMSLARLATHLATLPWWGEMTLTQSEFDTAGVPTPADAASRAELLSRFDTNAAKTRAALADRSDAELMAPWSLKRSGQTIFSMPKAAVWRSFVLSHLVHHRGQLSVYLRLLDVSVPSIYGPSADEGSF
ncbi:MAG TPA: DinB family protein [Vicinamibacterales bacterium]|jgi:uncharacterized damage-inducible protein DinB|nr:DinB family protein [Vicinamibacterales bacterium]